MNTAARTEGRPHDRKNVLALHHDYLDRRFATLITKAAGGDPVHMRLEWNRFERELLRHLEFEDVNILPDFAHDYPEEAVTLRAEHADIRRAVFDLGIKLDLHLLRVEDVEAFVRQLRAHARREELALYPWTERHLPRS